MNRSRVRAFIIALLGTVVVCGYSSLAILQILLLNPLAAVPGAGLEQIRRDMANAHEGISAPAVVGVMLVGPLVAFSILILGAARAKIGPLATATVYLVILLLGPFAYFVASFGPGMGLADTYGISGADYSPWAWPLYTASLLSLLALAGIGIVRLSRKRRSPPEPGLPLQ